MAIFVFFVFTCFTTEANSQNCVLQNRNTPFYEINYIYTALKSIQHESQSQFGLD